MYTRLGLAPELAHAAVACGLPQPNAVQRASIPLLLEGRDAWVSAPTGSGKTAAYALPLLQVLIARSVPVAQLAGGRRRLSALVLVPTRELAMQVHALLRQLVPASFAQLKSMAAFGGVSINPQLMRLRGGVEVLVATPGRLLDLIDHNALDLRFLEFLVLDEADRLLESGFAQEMARVRSLLPTRRQTVLVSATLTAQARDVAKLWLHDDANMIEIASRERENSQVPQEIVQRAIAVDQGQRTQLLRHLVAAWPSERVLVFVASKYNCELVAAKLQKAGVWALSFHGDMSQGARTQALAEFKAERWQVLVTTDLAARGIDIAQLPVVVNYDLPRSAGDYQHRIGRTGRAGASGLAISFVSASTEAHFRLIEKRHGMRLAREVIAGFEPKEPAPLTLDANGGVKGVRPSKKDKLRAAAARGEQ
jgi:ATP-dependent RNA helicase RhlE